MRKPRGSSPTTSFVAWSPRWTRARSRLIRVESSPKYLDPQVLARLEGLGLRARTIVEGYVSGVHRSPFHGFSIEFAEHREYAPGDDLSYLACKVFGRP